MTVEILVDGVWHEVDETKDEIEAWMWAETLEDWDPIDLKLPEGGEMTVRQRDLKGVRERE